MDKIYYFSYSEWDNRRNKWNNQKSTWIRKSWETHRTLIDAMNMNDFEFHDMFFKFKHQFRFSLVQSFGRSD